MSSPIKHQWNGGKTIYEDKLMLARGKIMADAHIKMLQRLFDAELDEASIQPV
ncbi:DNA polymerase III subunit gamma/tau C-terminal domain-containing protein [Candidatus Moranella endobia]|uniref:DNA polymerase III subunit gamma/tau C-terminal domain-containing protein n=1 Tax=Candidatus Moranella endobia TaxID=1048758 RepID=UPI0002DEDC8C|nr:DNA polymerase III subunit gamma/tau C-terminal domain-containing protein [Candidatus Moranella endobia]